MGRRNSIYFYDEAVAYRDCHKQARYSILPKNNNYVEEVCEKYLNIIQVMFYELIKERESCLLSWLCNVNNIYGKGENYIIKNRTHNNETRYDIYPLIIGLNTYITNGLDECYTIFFRCKFDNKIFLNLPFDYRQDYNNVAKELQRLDWNIKSILYEAIPNSNIQIRKPTELKNVKALERVFRIPEPGLTDKLNAFAEKRKAHDLALSEQFEQLQVSLQNELKQIREIREGIDYNITQEAISQFISLFSLLNDTLLYHSNSNSKESYTNLIESCEDLLANIIQSLAMLGVTIIDDVGKTFDPGKHKAVSGMQPNHLSTITKVVKIGFIYKNKVLEKAEVEIS